MTKVTKRLACEGATRPELEFVLACGRALVKPEAKEDVRLLIQNRLDWSEAMAVAEHHRLSPTVYEMVANAARDLVSPAQLNALREATTRSTTSSMVLLHELLRLQQLFEGAHLLIIPYKGPILAWIAYGSFVRREYSDLDFVVEQKFIPEVVSLLKVSGYSPQFDLREVHDGKKESAPGQYSFLSNPQKILVEIHSERTLRYFPKPIDFQVLASRSMIVEIGGQRLRTFSVEDTLVMLCVHGAKHFWERLNWVLDIAKLATVQEVNWPLALEIAGEMESTRVLLLGLYLAHDLFGAPLPEPVLRAISRNGAVGKLAEKVCDRYARISDPDEGVLQRAMFRIQSRDGIGQGLRHTLWLALSPTESDRGTIYLPRWLSPLYALVRPLRLLREYGSGLKRR
ncbi:MAG TPA: nucleotidyltransferase family protein [Candidatus Saccharimonadales bacterium]|nr:nucleotidyltransferase family protein [Candidatus Saccharimonadales bacterium]